MPLVIDYEPVAYRPTKRRRIQPESTMARQVGEEHDDSQYGKEPEDTSLETGCEVPTDTGQPPSPAQAEIQTSDRDELIECIKRGQRPTWVPKPGLKALYAEEQALQEKRNAHQDQHDPVSPTSTNFRFEDELWFGPWANTDGSHERNQSTLQAGISKEGESINSTNSATGIKNSAFGVGEAKHPFSSSPPSWSDDSSHSLIGQAVPAARALSTMSSARPVRPRAPSLSSSFIMRVPTSPLVNAVNNPNLDFSSKTNATEIQPLDKQSRRRTMPPSSFQSYSSSSLDLGAPNFSRPLPPPLLRRDSSYGQQTHQPRRSIGSFTLQSSPALQSPTFNTRRLSFASEASPKRRTSMIGSFEESILRGRMSSPASKPFDFVAQIGVMGKGDCPASLRCPAHVSVPFQAVFYSYPSSQSLRSIADDTPSPYVGTIDVEHNLKPVQLATKQKRRATVCVGMDTEALLSDADPRAPENTSIGRALAREANTEQQKQSAQSTSRMNLGGAYRVPQQGQLQIIIKNSNKTAVKLFLVPYDFEGMEPGTKTFIRQRSFSTGPIAEGALSDKAQNPKTFDPLKDKNILRYLIHIKFCCPSKGKFYIYDDIRVVFANRVPDGKEKLRNEVQLPEPKYSPWKAVKTPTHSRSSSTVDFSPIDMSSRQASSPGIFDDLRTMKLRDAESIPEEVPAVSEPVVPLHMSELPGKPRAPINNFGGRRDTPFAFPDIPIKEENSNKPEQTVSPIQGFFASTSPRASPIPWSGSSSSTTRPFSPAPVEAGSGLLSRQFRELRSLSIDEDEGSEIVMGARAATASLTRILSGNNSPQEKAEEEMK